MTSRVITGDCREVLATLDAGSVQCCVSSPPYFGLRDYGVDGQIGLEQSPDAYVAEMVAVFREIRRVLRDDGTVWLNIGDSYAAGKAGRTDHGCDDPTSTLGPDRRGLPNGQQPGPVIVRKAPAGYKPKDLLGIPWMVAFALRADGWWLRSDIIWAKPNPMPESVTDRPTSAHEHVFLLSKRASYYWDAEAVAEEAFLPAGTKRTMGTGDNPNGHGQFGRVVETGGTRNIRNVWSIATQPYSGAHFATMPPDLAERCIKAGTSERGQCPHCAAPWARVVERTVALTSGSGRSGRQPEGKHAGTAQAESGTYDIRMGPSVQSVTTGWRPTCACPAHAPVPQSVLDPFAGAGTTLLCADRLGRNGIGVELNPAYAVMARNRLTDDCPLFADVAD